MIKDKIIYNLNTGKCEPEVGSEREKEKREGVRKKKKILPLPKSIYNKTA